MSSPTMKTLWSHFLHPLKVVVVSLRDSSGDFSLPSEESGVRGKYDQVDACQKFHTSYDTFRL